MSPVDVYVRPSGVSALQDRTIRSIIRSSIPKPKECPARGSHPELAQVMVDVTVAPNQPIALAHLPERRMLAEGSAIGEGFHHLDEFGAIGRPVGRRGSSPALFYFR